MNRAERRKAAAMSAPNPTPGGKKIWVAIPNHDGGMKCLTVRSLMHDSFALWQRGDMVFPFFELGHADIYLLRAQIVARFLEDKNATHLVMCDNDVGWGAFGLVRLVDHPDADIVAGAYPKRSDPLRFMWRSKKQGHLTGDIHTSLMDVLGMPAGFMCIRREVLEKMSAHYDAELGCWDAAYGADGGAPAYIVRLFDPYWYTENGKRWTLSEDYSFCQRALDLGFKVQMDAAIPMAHIGSKAWNGCVLETLTPDDNEAKESADDKAA